MIADLIASIPGIDEAISFAQLMKSVQIFDHDIIVFDTAPTGHTMRLLGFPEIIDKAMTNLGGLGGVQQWQRQTGPYPWRAAGHCPLAA